MRQIQCPSRRTTAHNLVEGVGIRVSMNGSEQTLCNIFIQQPLRSARYEGTYVKSRASGSESMEGIHQLRICSSMAVYHNLCMITIPHLTYATCHRPGGYLAAWRLAPARLAPERSSQAGRSRRLSIAGSYRHVLL